uniref:Ig-like domain-containing protein n=1 Tax=Poecilia formosa TaxID=48698 RepID=A0A087XSK2_POEFO
SCPRSCNCYQANEVHCTFRSLLIVPPGLPAHTRRINLGFNSISRLHDKSLVGLRRVELLMLHSNNLQYLPDGVFKEMKSLQILKLSYNKLREISSSLTFSGLTSLLRLYLDHNLLQHIHPRALLQLPSLRLLRLQGNRLHQLHPHALCTLSILNTYYFSTLRHLDVSNNSLTILSEKSVTTAPLLETLVLQANPWSCDCRMNWFLSWSLAHPGLLKCPGGPQCPVCASPLSLQGQNLLDQATLHCTSPIISFPGKETPLESDHSKIQPSEKFREPLGNITLGLSDQQGYSVDLSCKITHSTDSPDVTPPPDLSWSSSFPLPLALSLPLDCPVLGQSYEKLWRILAYYSETAARLEREIMLSKAPALAYRYRQAPETDGYYHTGIKASVKARPEWLLQSAISIQLDRAQSNRHKVQLIYSTRVSAHPDQTFNPSLSSPTSHPWVMILTNCTNTAVTAVGVAGSNIQLSCPVLSSSNPSVQWILPDGSKLNTSSSSLDGRFQLSASGLLIQRVQLSDGGLYHCVARAGRDFDVLQLRLAVQESAVPYSGELSGPPVTGTIRDAVTLPCRISGSPEPLASWILPDGNVVWQGLAVSGGLKVHSNGSLSLLASTPKDTGYYRCIAVNQYGSDTMSMQLILKAQHISSLETSLPRGPQSAAGRSTKIPVPNFGQIDEGSGDEENEEDEKTSSSKRRYPTSLQPRPNRQHLIKKPQRYGRVREGHLKRIGGPTSPTMQKKHRFQNRPRVTTKKHRIDPQKWADLLAKIRQKTANSTNSQAIAEEKTTTQPIFEEKDEEIRQGGKGDDKDRSISHGSQEETESEGSSVDDATVKEEQPQPIQPPDKDAQTIKATQTIAEIHNMTERPHVNLEFDIKTQTEKENKQTVTTVNPETETERVTLTSLSGANGIESIVLDEKVPNLSPNRTRPQNPLQGLFPNAIPNSRPRRPWDIRRKIGQRRRINRPKIQPVPSQHPRSDPINSINQAVTLKSSPDKITKLLPLSTTTFPPIMLTLGNNVRTITNGVTVTPVSPTVSDPRFITISNFESPPLSPSSTAPHTYTNMMIHSGKKQITEESTFNSTPAPTHATIIISEPHVPEPDNRTFTHAAWAHTATQTTLGKHAERPPSKHSKELEMNALGESHFSITHSLTAPSVPSASLTTTSAAKIITTSSAAPKRASYFGSTKSTPASTTNEDTLPTTTTAAIISPTMSLSTPIILPISSTPRQTSALSTSMTSTITLPTTSSTISSTSTSNTKFRPMITRLRTTSSPSTSKSSSSISINAIPKVSISSFSTTSTDSKTTLPATTESILTTTPPTTTKQSTVKTLFSTTTTTELTSTKAITRNTKATGQVDHPANGQNRSQTPTDWKNHGANTIPDSHRSSFHQPSPSLPASPKVSFPPSLELSCFNYKLFILFYLHKHFEVKHKPTVSSYPTVKTPEGKNLAGMHNKSKNDLICPHMTVCTWLKNQKSAVYQTETKSFKDHKEIEMNLLTVQLVVPRCTNGRFWIIYLYCVLQNVWYYYLLDSTHTIMFIKCMYHVLFKSSKLQLCSSSLLCLWPININKKQSGSSSIALKVVALSFQLISTIIKFKAKTQRHTLRGNAKSPKFASEFTYSCFLIISKPRIADPHIRTISVPAGSTVNLVCEAQGEPKPSITWTKVATGAVMSIHSRAQRFEVLPNGTLVIQNVQVQDRGTYICSASSLLGHDRLLTTLEILTRPPHMQLMLYREVTIHQGGQVHLECQADGVPAPLLSWVLPNRSTLTSSGTFSNRIHMDTNGTLHISVTLPTDRGVYRCVASNSAGAASASVRLHVSSLPPVIQQPREEHLLFSVGWPVYAHCSARGAPTPILRWQIPDGTLVRPSQFLNGNLFVLPNGTLHIRNVGSKDTGNYECTASNAVGTTKRTVTVVVKDGEAKAHIVSTSPSATTVNYEGTLNLYCSVSGNPTPTIVWRTPTRKLVDMHYSFDQRVKVHPNGTLSVRAVTEKDSGDYLCIARNKVADDYRILRVSVVTKSPRIDPKQPINQMVFFGKPLKVDCQASGLPHPAVRWTLPNGNTVKSELFQEDSRGQRRQRTVFHNGTLLIPAVGEGDEGEYICYAENQAGRDTMKVIVKAMKTTPPTFTNGRGHYFIKVRQGETATIPCRATGDPAPTVTWFSPSFIVIPQSLGSGLSSQRVVVISDGSLEVHSAQKIDSGNYTCRASNSAGIRSMVVTLEVETSTSGIIDTHLGGGKIAKHRAVKGQAVTLPCPYQGYPPLRLAWLLPGNGMLPAPYYGSRLTVHRNGSLEFRDVRASDGGNLVCVAKTERGDALMRVQLEVSEPVVDVRSQQGREVGNIPPKGNLDVSQSLPTRTVSPLQHSQRGLGVPDRSHSINSPPSSGSVSKPTVRTSTAPLVSTINGETLRLHCPSSTTRGSVSWTMPSGKILSRGDSSDLGRYVVQEDGTLVIKQVSVFDRGSYICRFSSLDSSSVSVTTVPVIVIAYPPRITIGPSPVTYTRGGVAVELPCMTIATPRATVSWETPDLTQLSVMGQPRIYGNLYLSPQGSLVIQNPTHRDTGFYRCIAKNVIGVDSKATYLHVM